MRLLAALAVLVGGLVSVGVVASVEEPAGAQSLPPEPLVNLIAYVTADGQVRTVAPDGLNDALLSPDDDGFYTWPAWSPEGLIGVFSGVLDGTTDDVQIVLFESDVLSRATGRLHSSPKGFAGLLAQGVVHYPIWSPDGGHIAFIGSTETGLTLYLDDRTDDEPPWELLDEGPLWLNWSADSRYLLVHRARELLLVDVASADKDDGEKYAITQISDLAERFRVPAWSPIDNRFAFVERDGIGDHVIYVATVDGSKRRVDRAPVTQTALSWSPDGRYLAVHGADGVITYLDHPVLLGEGFRLYEAVSPESDPDLSDLMLGNLGVGDVMMAMFWSPDGSRIAYVTAPDARGVLSWRLYDVQTNESRMLAAWTPSAQQLVLLSFFDQYAISHSPWSPDGLNLVFGGQLWQGVVTVAQTTGSQVIVLPVDAPGLVRPIADGILGFWSPR
jgi:Tol biopolymer transport system component